MKPLVNIEDVITFLLKKGYIQEKPLKVDPISSGGSSYNFIFQLSREKIFCKIFKTSQNSTFENFYSCFKRCSFIPQLLTPILHIGSMQVVLMEYRRGIILKPSKIDASMLTSVIKIHKQFLQRLNKCTISVKKEENLLNLRSELLHKLQKQSWPVLAVLRKFVFDLKNVDSNILMYQPKNIQKIHGDWTARNLLIQNHKVSSVLDLEELHYGYVTEDWCRFMFCATERYFLQSMRFHFLSRVCPMLIQNLSYKQNQWLFGMWAFFMRKLSRALSKNQSFGLCKAVSFMLFYRLVSYVMYKSLKLS